MVFPGGVQQFLGIIFVKAIFMRYFKTTKLNNTKLYHIYDSKKMASSNSEIHITEVDKTGGAQCYSVDLTSKEKLSDELQEQSLLYGYWKKIRSFRLSTLFIFIQQLLSNLLLPIGYPETVCPEYIKFQFWDTLQEACGYFRSILSNQAYLINLGVGNPDTTVFSAIVMTMILDYVSMVSGLFYAGSADTVRKFAVNQKFFTMFKELLDLIAQSFTLVSIAFPEHMIFILIMRNIISSGASVIGGCCHATLVTHIARKNNFSDCNAKEGNQHRTLKFFIIVLGYQFLIYINEDGKRALIAFAILSLFKLLCQYGALSTLKLRTLSPFRLQMCVKAWCQCKYDEMKIPQVALKEAKIYPQYANVNIVGTSINKLNCSGKEIAHIIHIYDEVKHIFIPGVGKNKDSVLLKDDAGERDIIMGYINAFIYSSIVNKDQRGGEIIQEDIKSAFELTRSGGSLIIEKLKENGWDVENTTLLPSTTKRIQLSNEKKDL